MQPLSSSQQTWRWLLIAAGFAVLGWFVLSAGSALFPFGLGLVFAYILLPLVNRLEAVLPWPKKATTRRSLAILLVYAIVLVIVALTLTFLVPALIGQVIHFVETVPDYVQQVQATLDKWTGQYRATVPENVQVWVDQQVQAATAGLQGFGQSLALNAVRMVTATVGTVVGLLVIPVWLFFVLKDQRPAMHAFFGIFSPDVRPTVRDLVFIVDHILGRYIRAQLILGLVVGIVTFIGLTALGIPFAPVLAVISAIGELIPIIGPIVGAVPGILVVLATDPSRVLVVTLLYWVIQLLENNLLVPRIQGDAVQLSPAVIMILLVGGAEAAGVIGLLTAVPLAAILREVFVYLYRRTGGHLAARPAEIALRDYVAQTAVADDAREPAEARTAAQRPGPVTRPPDA